MNLQWPNFYDFINDKNQDVPEPNQLIDEFCYRVSDLGIPLSEDGAAFLNKLEKGTQDRNQDLFDMHIYSDWNGWGISECFENHVCLTILLNWCQRWNGKRQKLTCWHIVEGFQQGYIQEDRQSLQEMGICRRHHRLPQLVRITFLVVEYAPPLP
jgi:hypothetical protein